MYRVIGIDSGQYGPISAERLRAWLAEHRLNAQSLVQSEGSSEWKPLGSFAEFADALKTTSPPPPLAGSPPNRMFTRWPPKSWRAITRTFLAAR